MCKALQLTLYLGDPPPATDCLVILCLFQRSDSMRPALTSPVERPNSDLDEGEVSTQVRATHQGESTWAVEEACGPYMCGTCDKSTENQVLGSSPKLVGFCFFFSHFYLFEF